MNESTNPKMSVRLATMQQCTKILDAFHTFHVLSLAMIKQGCIACTSVQSAG
jgi:hypothetical protein